MILKKGARISTMLMSIITTAKSNNLNVYPYLKHLMEQIFKMKNKTSSGNPISEESLNSLLPWNETIKEQFKN